MVDREQLKLGSEINKHFVKGLMKGYERYLEVRVEADEELKISNGYAYTRGNHLEDKIAKEISDKVTYEPAKAGSWNYLQFNVGNNDEKYLVIVRRSERIEETRKELKLKNSEDREENWLYGLARNNDHLNLSQLIKEDSNEEIKLFASNFEDEKAISGQMELNFNNVQEFDRFYVLTYEINDSTYMIDDASLLMMDSQTLGLVEVESLRDLVVEYRTIINNDLLTNVKRVFDKEVFSAGTQEYKVYPSEEETSGDLLEYLSEDASQDETEEDI